MVVIRRVLSPDVMLYADETVAYIPDLVKPESVS